MTIRSAPPSASALICSAKAARACSGCTRPKGAMRTPRGPTSPAMSTSLNDAETTRFASSTPLQLISTTSSCKPCLLNLKRFAPNVLVIINCAPASIYSRWISATAAGCVRLSSSKHLSKPMPRAWSMVPIAPSMRRVEVSRSSKNC